MKQNLRMNKMELHVWLFFLSMYSIMFIMIMILSSQLAELRKMIIHLEMKNDDFEDIVKRKLSNTRIPS
jgi:hypothetical protein